MDKFRQFANVRVRWPKDAGNQAHRCWRNRSGLIASTEEKKDFDLVKTNLMWNIRLT